jgi:gamma-glutamyltranspeptidase/glutathione hydrolase
MVASVHQLASQAGVDAMRRGGNAVDAAVATAFVLAVVHPQAGNIGGGGFMLVRLADGDTHFVDYREKAPAAATREMYLAPPDSKDAGTVIADASLVGYRSIAVPGSVAGMYYAHKQWGKLKWASLLQPAIRLARSGFRVSQEDAEDFRDIDYKELADFPASKKIFLKNGKYYEAGDRLRQPALARTFTRLAANPMEFYRGRMARQIAAFLQKNGGLITAQDLAQYEVKDRRPVRGYYRGYELIGAPPPSSGGIVLIETLNILEGYDLGRLGYRSSESMHLTSEALRRAFYDRAGFLGDSDFATVPVAQLIDKRYAEAWRVTIDPAHATPSAELKRPRFENLDVSAGLHRNGAPPARPESDHTTHVSVVDAYGNAVALTTTLNDAFGSRVTHPTLGFLFNDEMDDFTAAPGVPNTYGLIQGEANAIQPGKRPLSAMAPTIVLKDGKLFMVLGSPGGPRIISSVLNVLTGVLDHGLDVQQAVAAPRFHHQWMPDELRLERFGFSADALHGLRGRGHKLTFPARYSYWSDVEAIMVDPKTGELLGATDPRGNGKAIGY